MKNTDSRLTAAEFAKAYPKLHSRYVFPAGCRAAEPHETPGGQGPYMVSRDKKLAGVFAIRDDDRLMVLKIKGNGAYPLPRVA